MRYNVVFDACYPQHQKLNYSSVDLLLARVKKTVADTALKQFGILTFLKPHQHILLQVYYKKQTN